MKLEFSKEDGKRYDVVCVSLDDSRVLWVEEDKSLPNAEAIIAMAVMRQGVEDRFFTEVPAGKFKEGDKYNDVTGNN